MSIMTCRVKNCDNMNCLRRFKNLVNNAIGKTLRVAPAQIFGWVFTGGTQWAGSHPIPNLGNFLDELRSQSRLVAFVPKSSFRQISFHLRSDDQLPTHLERRARSRAIMVSPEMLVSGFCLCAAR